MLNKRKFFQEDNILLHSFGILHKGNYPETLLSEGTLSMQPRLVKLANLLSVAKMVINIVYPDLPAYVLSALPLELTQCEKAHHL